MLSLMLNPENRVISIELFKLKLSSKKMISFASGYPGVVWLYCCLSINKVVGGVYFTASFDQSEQCLLIC